jgi:transposase-like protein
VRHVALDQPAEIHARVGVYRARCDCQKTFRAPIPGVPAGGTYSFQVRQVVANSLIRDRLPYRKVRERMREDFLLAVSLGFIHNCFQWAYDQIDPEERRRWAAENFSGVLCIDEVHEGPRVILYATDPFCDLTVHFAINEKNDQEHMNAFLNELKEMGVTPEVVITDGSSLYKDSLREIWKDVEHQLCIFHVIKEVNSVVLDAFRALRRQIARQGNKGRRRKRGRPSKAAQKRCLSCRRRTRKQEAAFLWDHQHLLVRKDDSLTDEDRGLLGEMIEIAPEVKLLRRFVKDFYGLFRRENTQQRARYRRTRMVNNPAYQAHPVLKRALRKIRKERFEKMIVFLGREGDSERTSNHVERNNRSFRMLQKTRYKRRTVRTIAMSIELDLYARMLQHILYLERDILYSPRKPKPRSRRAG